ncbi:RagB/SusD family nutrient uptake outer membrane protein [Marinifilum fragile]|uniref:RagB/SusD family nutrient uptake outer membrane protein n=1 Tax=Marinifilum fragile TaxID=570161 RepID=UPI0006D2A30B|nr:RagB/SusD family nutrient uptake outer membrane protein [Marinifilum fragile]
MNKIFYSLLLAVMVLSSSCEDLLDLKPTDSIDEGKAFENVEDLEPGMLGVYSSFGGSGAIVNSSRAGDDLRLSDENTGQGVQMHNWTFTASEGSTGSVWVDMAHTIDRANRVLAAAEKFAANNENAALVNRIVGEAKFMRAYCHFELVRLFSGNYSPDALAVPYILESNVAAEPARDKASVVYANIINDLKDAQSLLPADFTDRTRATKDAATALLARVALYQNDWANAIAYASDVIDNSAVRMANASEIASLWTDESADDVEVLFRRARTTPGEGLLGDIYTRSGNGDVFFHPGVDLMSKYTAEDARFNVYFTQVDGKDVVAKHRGKVGGTLNLVDVKLLRISELYLIRAEASARRNEGNDLANAADDINMLRANRIADYTNISFASQTLAMDEILLERRKELAYEGHRFYDLRRFEKSIHRIEEDALLASNVNLEAGDYRFVFPIPIEEIFANDNMVQNPGY